MTCFPFFFNTWEEYYSGELNLPIINGVGEGTVVACIVMIFSGEVGKEFWSQNVNLFGETYILKHITVIVFFLTGVSFSVLNIVNVLTEFRDKLSDAIQNLLIFLFLVLSLFIVVIYGESYIIKEYPKIVNILYGFSFAKLVGHLQLAHLSNAKFMQYRKSLLISFILLPAITILKYFYNIHLVDLDILIVVNLILHIIGKLNIQLFNAIIIKFSMDAFCILCYRRIVRNSEYKQI